MTKIKVKQVSTQDVAKALKEGNTKQDTYYFKDDNGKFNEITSAIQFFQMISNSSSFSTSFYKQIKN